MFSSKKIEIILHLVYNVNNITCFKVYLSYITRLIFRSRVVIIVYLPSHFRSYLR